MSEKSEKNIVWDKIPFLQKLKNVKHIELIVISIFVLILAVIYISSLGSKDEKLNINSDTSLEEYGNYLETKLMNVIENIDGAGNVSVMLTFDGRITYEYATESEEVTTSSSVTSGTNTKTVVNEKVIIVNRDGKDTPLVTREIYPEIAGVVIVASGAGNVAVKLNIISAVETLLSIDDSKINVLMGST